MPSALLVEKNEDLCARSYRRADGTIRTADYPVGLRVRAVHLRRRIGWTIAGIFGLATAWAQDRAPMLSDVVDDANVTPAANVEVIALNASSGKKVTVVTDKEGTFRFDTLEVGMVRTSSP
jgi:hypothetical protein